MPTFVSIFIIGFKLVDCRPPSVYHKARIEAGRQKKEKKNMNKRMVGKVKFWKRDVKWGFAVITGGDEVFLHHTKITDKTYTPQSGDTVEFSVEETNKGKVAVEVVKI